MRQLILSTAAAFCREILLSDHTADIFFCLMPGGHDLMSAAKASQAKISTGTKYQPPFFSAGVFFFHYKYILKPNIHKFSPYFRAYLLVFDGFPVAFRRLLQLVFTVFIVLCTHQLIGQILLIDPVTREAVRILISLLTLHGVGICMNVL